ncbi:MAG: tyrosine-type recombinase/integrase, partial [Acidobacteria bacterium]|nr:tyrosine-type recombinase/integrase [Acidobacteriota bacterium]
TINRELNTARAVFNFGEQEERIIRNPIARGSVQLLPSRGPRQGFFEPEEWRAFLAAFDDYEGFKAHLQRRREEMPSRFVGEKDMGSGRRNPESEASREQFDRLQEAGAFIRAMLFSCARVMELARMRWRDVDFRRGLATLFQEKTQAEKVIPISAPWRVDLIARPRGLPDAYVYVRSTGKPFYEEEVRRAVMLAVSIAAIRKHLTPHSIRHTALSWLAIAGAPEAHRKDFAGHSRKSVADGYAHLTRGSLVPVVALLARIEAEGFREEESAQEDVRAEV